MALSPTVTSMCNQLTQKYEGIVNPVKAAKSSIKSQTRTLISGLKSAVFNPIGDLQDEMNSLQEKVNGVVPGDTLGDVSEIENFLKNCPFFGTQSTGVGAVRGSQTSIFDQIDQFIQDSYSLYDEFGMAALADGINKLLNGAEFPGGSSLSESLASADVLIQCLASLCPGYNPYVISYQDDVNALYDEMNIVSNPLSVNYGKLDYDYVYTQAGLNPTQISNMNYVIGGVTDLKSGAMTSINNSVAAMKNAIGGGLI